MPMVVRPEVRPPCGDRGVLPAGRVKHPWSCKDGTGQEPHGVPCRFHARVQWRRKNVALRSLRETSGRGLPLGACMWFTHRMPAAAKQKQKNLQMCCPVPHARIRRKTVRLAADLRALPHSLNSRKLTKQGQRTRAGGTLPPCSHADALSSTLRSRPWHSLSMHAQTPMKCEHTQVHVRDDYSLHVHTTAGRPAG